MGAEALLLNDQTKSRPWEETIERALAAVKPNEKYALVSNNTQHYILF